MPQFSLIRDATDAFGVARVEHEGYEADDLIAAYAKAFEATGGHVTIVSSDKDLMQLIRPAVQMLDPMKQKPLRAPEVLEKFGVTPDKVVEVQALAGDATDNVPGVPGIGIKTAAQLINEYGDLETLLARAGEIKQPKRREALLENAEMARISRRLVALDDNAPLPLEIAALEAKAPGDGKLEAFLRTQGFRSILARMGFGEAGGAPHRGDVCEFQRIHSTRRPTHFLKNKVEKGLKKSWHAVCLKGASSDSALCLRNFDTSILETCT